MTYGLGDPALDGEGRIITLEFPQFYCVTCYTPNAQDGLRRLDFRMQWDDAFRARLSALDAEKPVVACGDLNVAHRGERPAEEPGAEPRQRRIFRRGARPVLPALLAAGLHRHLPLSPTPEPDAARTPGGAIASTPGRRTPGWRIDYFLISDRLRPALQRADILQDIMGSDHCPVQITLDEKGWQV